MTIVGGGGGEDEARVDTSVRRGAVEFVGMQPHAEVIRRLTAAAVHPSGITASDGDSEGGRRSCSGAGDRHTIRRRHADIHVVPEGACICLHDVDALGLASWRRFAHAVGAAHVIAEHDVVNVMPRLETLYARAAEGAAIRAKESRR